jgi:hypothetical protein
MNGALERHVTRLALLCGSLLVSTFLYAAVVYLVPRPPVPPMTQLDSLVWVLAAVVLLNLVSLTPVYRAMLAGPIRIYAVSQELQPLLRAHLSAQVVLFARLEAVAIVGLLLYFLTGRGDVFWAFMVVAVAGMALLWPSKGRVKASLGLP